MDQNRCLLDVIDNPQLLQSFLESESSAEATNNNTHNDNTRATNNIQPTANITTADSSAQDATAPNRFYPSTANTVTAATSLGNSNSGFTNHASDHDQGDIVLGASYSNDNAPEDHPSATSEKVSAPFGTDHRFKGADAGDEINSVVDPVISVLDLIITETVAETSPSSTHQDANDVVEAAPNATGNDIFNHSEAGKLAVSYSISEDAPRSLSSSRAALGSSSPALDSTLTYHNVGTGNITDLNDANNNSTSSSDNGSNDLLVDEFYSQRLHQPSGHDQQESAQFQHIDQAPFEQPESSNNPPAPNETTPTAIKLEENATNETSIDPQPIKEEHNHNFQHQQPVQDLQYQSQPQEQPSFALHNQLNTQPPTETQPDQMNRPKAETSVQLTEPSIQQPSLAQNQQQQPSQPAPQTAQQQQQQPQAQSSNAGNNASQSSATGPKSTESKKATKSTSKTNASKTTPESKPKRAPRPKKNAKTTNNTTVPNQPTAPTNAPMKPMQTQFITTSQGQQQVIFQNNNGIRQPTMMAPTNMGQTMGGMPQTQRVIQIQTANGPMYFAIAPGPAANTSNSNIGMNQQQQQQQQPGMQSQQYPSQQICFQPGTNVMMNRPQMSQTISPQRHQMSPHQQQQIMQQRPQQMQMQQPHLQQQNQQMGGNVVVSGHQMMQPTHQQRHGSPVVAIANQQGSHQQQHVMINSSQQMMMPRMPNQILINRPMGGTGQVMSGQQQFIQIMTPNGPMLLALPQQQQQQQQQHQQQQQAVNNSMSDYNNQVQSTQMSGQMQQQQQQGVQKGTDTPDGKSNSKQSGTNPSKNAANSKSGLDLGDLLLDCGILPDDRAASQSSSSIKSSQSPALSQISSPMPPSLPQTNSPMPSIESTSFSTNHPQPTQQPMPGYGQYQGQPIRITMGPDGQMIMQPAVYGAIRPVIAGGMAQSPQLNTMSPNNIISSSNSIMTMTPSNPSTPKPATTDSTTPADNSKKPNAKGRGTAVKRSRSKKSDIDKFPQLKTPKIAQQQQQQQQQQQSQAVVVPMTFLVGDQSKVLAGSPDVKPNIAQLGSGQQVSIAKFVSPGIQSTSIQSPMSTNMMQSGMTQHANQLATSQMQVVNSGQMNTQLMTNSGNSINISSMQQQQNATQGMIITSNAQHSSATSQMSSSGNVTKKLMLIKDVKTGTVESNPHISSSLMPTLSLTVDNLKIEPNGLKTTNTGQTTTTQNFKGQIIHSVGGLTTTLVLHPAQAQQRHNITIQKQAQLQQQQQLARQKELRAQSILNQLKADQNAALNPQTKQSFQSLEDACKRLLRYHVFDTESVSEEKISAVDDIFEAAVESLLSRKQAIYDKYRLLILKQSMKTVPLSEKVMMEQVFVNDELSYLKKERELFREYEAHLDKMASQQSRDDAKSEYGGTDYFPFGGTSSPKQDNHHPVDEDSASRSRDVDDWLLPNKWADSRYSSVPDSEAATAIESILNDEIS